MMTRDELIRIAYVLVAETRALLRSKRHMARAAGRWGGNLRDLNIDQIESLMTASQFVTDLCLNEVERRGELAFFDGKPVIPYVSDHFVETVLTRSDSDRAEEETQVIELNADTLEVKIVSPPPGGFLQ
jgi:hypothetical protein